MTSISGGLQHTLKIINLAFTIAAEYLQHCAPLSSKTQVLKPCVGLILLVTSFDVTAQTHGTTVMIMRTPREISVAADSYAVDAERRFVRRVCKIRRFDKFF